MYRLPHALLALRLLCAPGIGLAYACGAPGWVLVAILAVAFLSDVFDGIAARRLGLATATLRRADSLIDTVFYIAATAVLLLHAPSVLATHAVGIGVLLGLEGLRFVVERLKFGRVAAYHMWSAKAWGVALLLGFAEVYLTGAAGPFFTAAVALGIITDLEGLAASLVFSSWHHDVPSVLHAVRLERTERAARHPMKPPASHQP